MAAVNGVGSHQESLKRRCDEKGGPCTSTPPLFTGFGGGARTTMAAPSTSKKLLSFSLLDDEGAAALAVIPPVTVVLEGRSICHRVRLHQHASYESLALALRRLFVDDADEEGRGAAGESRRGGLDLSNAVPGYVVAYEDAEDDLLLAGDLDWKDFVRVAKRIRVLPAKASRRRRRGGGNTVVATSFHRAGSPRQMINGEIETTPVRMHVPKPQDGGGSCRERTVSL